MRRYDSKNNAIFFFKKVSKTSKKKYSQLLFYIFLRCAVDVRAFGQKRSSGSGAHLRSSYARWATRGKARAATGSTGERVRGVRIWQRAPPSLSHLCQSSSSPTMTTGVSTIIYQQNFSINQRTTGTGRLVKLNSQLFKIITSTDYRIQDS
jgi:hypothetical protein